MAQNRPQNSNQDIFQFLNENQKVKVIRSLLYGDEHYRDLVESLEQIIDVFEEVQYQYSETEFYYQIRDFLQNLKKIVYNLPSPAQIVSQAEEERQ